MDLTAFFGGRFQCRLATDPDPYDEAFGLRGTACALPAEPPFDRVIRTSGAKARDGCPPIGITMSYCSHPDHTVASLLAGAAVTLEPQSVTDGPFFESWSGINAVPWEEPLSGVDVQFALGSDILLRRRHLQPMVAPLPIQPSLPRPAFEELKALADALAAPDGSELATRRAYLAERADAAMRPEDRDVALLRLALLAASDRDFGRDAYRFGLCWECDLDAPPTLGARLAAAGVRADAGWRARLLFTRWDFDSLSGVLVGSLTLPLRA